MTEDEAEYGRSGGTAIALDVFADPVCPWCLIGLHGLAIAMRRPEASRIAPRLRPYLLYDRPPPAGLSRAEVYARKMPDPEQRQAVMAELAKAARAVGRARDLAKAARIPDAAPAQALIGRLVPGAEQLGFALAVYDAYWTDGAAIDEPSTLGALAEAAGIPGAAVEAAFGEGAEAARLEAATARRGGVDAAPTFVVDGRTGFAGALPPDRLLAAIDHACGLNAGAAQ